VDQKSLYRGKFLEMASLGKWEFVRRVSAAGRNPYAVGIVAVTEDHRIILITQFRVPVGRVCVEIPAGLVGDHSDAEGWKSAAMRELREETGYTAETMELLTEGPTSAGLTNELITLVRAVGTKYEGAPEPDGDEKIEVHVVPLEGVDAFLAKRVAMGDLVDPKVYAALYFVLRNGRAKN
jgi:ADP-ribose pyrophosphatase